MIKYEYLEYDYIVEFCDWFSVRLESTELAHSWKDRRTGQIVRFQHIYDAYKQYAWPFNLRLPDQPSFFGRSFNENHKALTTLQTGLRDAVTRKHDDMDTLCWSHAVLRWGGVFPGNGKWLTEHKDGLADYFDIRVACLGSCADDSAMNEFTRFNSGMTKIYSLLADDFIIYDTRVAAALGWVVVKYCREQGFHEVPGGLRFPCGAAKEAQDMLRPKQRNPSEGNLRFPRLQPGVEHARWNLRVSWLLSEVISKTQSAFKKLDDPLRALEAALFMIGYDLGNSTTDQIASIPHLDSESVISINPDENAYPLITRGPGAKAKNFCYEYTGSNILIRNKENKEYHFEKHKAEEILTSLYRQFGNNWFPLANNVQKLGNGTEIPGLGRTILDAYPGNIPQAQAASYFGPTMEDMGLFEWNGKNMGIAWRLTCEPRIHLLELDD